MKTENNYLEELQEELRRIEAKSRASYEPYDYEKYRKINSELTEETYRHLWQNYSLWKVMCGKEVSTHWGLVLLKRVWWRDTEENYIRRFKHGFNGYIW